ncbi:MAG: RIP metalloprotease RseP [Verrucomicrobiota bacterium]
MDILTILSFIITFIGALFVFGITVFVHELGHYLAAKQQGLVIEKFAIGFGPKIFGFKHDGVEWVINWLPIGGFVALPQMAPMDMVEGETEKKAVDLPEISPKAKIITAFFGPLFSFLLAVVAAVAVSFIGYPKSIDSKTTTIGFFSDTSPAQSAGMEIGDKILSVNGKKVICWQGHPDGLVETIIFNSDGSPLKIEVEKALGGVKTYDVTPVKNPDLENLYTIGIMAAQGNIMVGNVIDNSPAQKAGLQKNDIVLKVNGEKVYNTLQITEKVDEAPTQPIELIIEREGKKMPFSVKPEYPVYDKDGEKVPYERPIIGIGWAVDPERDTYIYKPSPMEQIVHNGTLVFRVLNALITPNDGINAGHISGPIGILRSVQHSWLADWRFVLSFCVMLNVNLAILNLLPIPVLDGGHIVISIVEWIRRRPVEGKFLYATQSAFFVLLMGFILFVTFKDLSREVRGFKQGQELSEIREKNRTLSFPEKPITIKESQ